MQNLTVGLLKRIAAAIAAQFGSNCEVVIYDLTCENPEDMILYIENGHVSKRSAKAGPSHVVLEAMRDGRKDIPDHYNYLTKTHDGRILRSSTIYIKDEDGREMQSAPNPKQTVIVNCPFILRRDDMLRRREETVWRS